MTTKTKILISILAVGIILVAGFWIWNQWFYLSYYCADLYGEFRSKIEKLDKSCQFDEDCKLTDLGICVNKSKYISEIEDFEKLLIKKCSGFLPAEMMPPDLRCKCENNICKQIREKQQEQVTITTDKTEYEQGDMVTVVVTNRKEVSILCSSFPFMLYRYKDDRWEIFLYPWREGFNEPQVEVVSPFKEIEPGLTRMEANISRDFNDLVDTKWMTSGRYKIEFQYTLDPDKEELEIIFSNAFTIKEKITLNPLCSKKVKLVGPCDAEVQGYEFSLDTGKCIVINGSACSVETPFDSLEECQKICE